MHRVPLIPFFVIDLRGFLSYMCLEADSGEKNLKFMKLPPDRYGQPVPVKSILRSLLSP